VKTFGPCSAYRSCKAEGNHERPATAKVASEWLADAGPTLLIRQKFETTRKDPERKFERYESKEVCLAKVEDKTLLDDWYELKRTRPQDCEAISKLNHDNWEKEKLTRRLEKQEREEYQPQEEEHSSFDFEEHDSLCWRYRRFLQLFCGGCQTS